MLKLSAHIGYLFTEQPLVDRFLAARDAGFVSVDLSDVVRYPLAEILEGMRRSGLPFRQTTAAALPVDRGGPGLTALPGREGEFRTACAAVLNYFEGTGLRWVHLPSGAPSPEIPFARSRRDRSNAGGRRTDWYPRAGFEQPSKARSLHAVRYAGHGGKGLASLSEAGFEALPSAFSPAGSSVLLHEVIQNRELMGYDGQCQLSASVLS